MNAHSHAIAPSTSSTHTRGQCRSATAAKQIVPKAMQTGTPIGLLRHTAASLSPVPTNNPAYIHCASGNRVSAMWMIKRMVIDHWDADRAYTEASALGLTNAALKQFAIDYAQTHRR